MLEIKWEFPIWKNHSYEVINKNGQAKYLLFTNAFKKHYVPIYQLKDWDGDDIKGYLRNNELQKVEVEADNLYQIDQILIRRTKSKVKEVRVSWLGWPKKKIFMDLRKYYKKNLKIKHLNKMKHVLNLDDL
jgi:hypothetical protein